MKKKHFYAAAILLLFLAVGIQPAIAYTWVISFGQEYTFGEWEGTTFKFSNDTPVGDSIQIGEDNVIIDGAGYTVNSGSSPQTNGVFVQEKSYVTIKNLKVQNFDTGIKILSSHNITLTGNEVSGCNAGQFSSGIYLSYAYESDLTENTVSNNSYGIHLQYMYSNLETHQGNTLTNNTALDNTYGIALSSNYYSILTSNTVSGNGQGINIYGYGPPDKPGNTLTNNNASNNDFGIRLHTAKSNTLTGNSVKSNTSGGIYLTNSDDNTVENNTISDNGFGIKLNPSDDNQIYNNNFINNAPQAVVDEDCTDNLFNLPATEGGGNYWSDWIPGSGPYEFTGGQDNLPWAEPNGWLLPDTSPPEITCPGDITVEAMSPNGVPVDDERIQTFLAGASATDNCDPPEDITITTNAPTLFPPGDTPVTFTATDTSGNSSTCQSTVTVEEAAEGHLRIIPPVINREGRLQRILAVIRFPEGTTEEDIDIGQPLILYPGDSLDGIEAISQRIVTWYRWGTLRVSVFASFSKNEVTAGVPEDGLVELMVIGRFTDGQYFYGLDTVRIISWDWPCW